MKEIYLDANATTPVLPFAQAAAMAAMADIYGNPSSVHSSGLRAKALLDDVRRKAQGVLGTAEGRILFNSGATEGIQTAVLSALTDLRKRRDRGVWIPSTLLYGATEHKAIPEALRHWNALLGLNLEVIAIPVGADGRHDIVWLKQRASDAGLICTMAVNNETGVQSDLDAIASIVRSSPSLWLVDGVQALGKVPLRLMEWGVDYAPFSGHKVYAPKGVGMLYVGPTAPFTALIAGGGQEGSLRSGTENMAGIAALGAVLSALDSGGVFRTAEELLSSRAHLVNALQEAFPGVLLNAPLERSLPTTINFSVPGLESRTLLDVFDAAGIRVSAGSACGAAKAAPSYVLEAMGMPEWRTSSAVRMSFGAADCPDDIAEACRRIRACGESLREFCEVPSSLNADAPVARITRFSVDGAVCYVVADPNTKTCAVIDPLPELTGRLSTWLRCHCCSVAAILDTHSHGDHASSAAVLRDAVSGLLRGVGDLDALGWPEGQSEISLGSIRLSRLPVPGHTRDSTAYLVRDDGDLLAALVGDTVLRGALGRSDFSISDPGSFVASLKSLEKEVLPTTLLLPAHDYTDAFAITLEAERKDQPLLDAVLSGRLSSQQFACEKALAEQHIEPTKYQTLACGVRADAEIDDDAVEMSLNDLSAASSAVANPVLVDVREAYEQRLNPLASNWTSFEKVQPTFESAPLSEAVGHFARWINQPSDTPLIFCCRSGSRSKRLAIALRRLGNANCWSLAGGLALLAPAQARHPAPSMES